MHLVQNDVQNVEHASENIEGSSISWGMFAKVTNEEIIKLNQEIGSSADKRLGAYFVRISELSRNKFPEKVLKYLWDDAFKMDHYVYFNDDILSLDSIIEIFNNNALGVDPLKRILKYSVYIKMLDKSDINNEE